MAVQPKNQQADEIDLGQVFQIIGGAFSRLGDFLSGLFKGLVRILIIALLFLRKNFLLLFGSAVVGLVAGYMIDQQTPVRYSSNMVVEPNFSSSQQLYNNVAFYNELAKTGDSIALSAVLGISESEAASIQDVRIASYSDENQKLKLFDNFVRSLDTTTIKSIDYSSYLKNFNSLDARFHQITITSTNKLVAKRAQDAIIQSVSGNQYFKLQKQINDENIQLQEEIYKKQLTEIDSLLAFYQEVVLKQAENPSQGMQINFSDAQLESNRELSLLKERNEVKEMLVRLNLEKANKGSILNIISDFPSQGVREKGLLKEFKYLLPLILLGLILTGLALLELNRFLTGIERNSASQ